MTGHDFWLIIQRHHLIPCANILARSMFGFKVRIRVLEPLIEFLAFLVQKLGHKTATW